MKVVQFRVSESTSDLALYSVFMAHHDTTTHPVAQPCLLYQSIRCTSCSSGPEPASHSDVCYPAIVPCQLTVTPHTIVAGHQHRKLLALIGANRAVRAPQDSVNARCPRAYIRKRACRSCRGSQRYTAGIPCHDCTCEHAAHGCGWTFLRSALEDTDTPHCFHTVLEGIFRISDSHTAAPKAENVRLCARPDAAEGMPAVMRRGRRDHGLRPQRRLAPSDTQ